MCLLHPLAHARVVAKVLVPFCLYQFPDHVLVHVQRLQPEPSGAKLGNSSGSNTSRYMGDKVEGVRLVPPLHSSGAVTQRGAKISAWLAQPRKHQ